VHFAETELLSAEIQAFARVLNCEQSVLRGNSLLGGGVVAGAAANGQEVWDLTCQRCYQPTQLLVCMLAAERQPEVS
jgi:hypothetical protein